MQVNIPAARLDIIERVATHARKNQGAKGGRTGVNVESFIRSYYSGVAEEDLAAHGTDYLAALARAHLAYGSTRKPGTPLVAVLNPDPATEGLRSRHTLVLVVTDDMPFLLDSLGIVLNQSGLAMHFIVHPVIRVRRDARGRLLDLPDAEATAAQLESWQLFEIDRETDADRLVQLRERLLATLDDVRCATGDWLEMRQRARDLAGSLEVQPPPLPSSDVLEAKALLEWMDDNHFTFLGYREYRLKRGRTEDLLEPLPASGLGLLRPNRAGRGTPKPTRLTGEIRDFGRSRDLLVITKANAFSTVHRGTYLDYVGVKTFDAKGEVTGERRFIGLWTSSAYSGNPRKIPVLRHRVQQVVAHFGLSPTSHDGKAIIHVLENYPRDELFQASIPDLIRIARGIVNLYDRAQVRMFVRRDAFRRFYSCLVYVPRDRYNTIVRQRIEAIVREAFGGLAIESQVQMSESVLARVHLLVRTDPANTVVADVGRLEQALTVAVRTWQDHFKDALLARHDEATALGLHRAYAGRFAAAYLEDAQPAAAVDDVAALESLGSEASGLRMSLYRAAGQPGSKLQFKLFRRGRPLPICDVLPTIENMGLRLISERPYELAGPEPLWIQDFELEHPGGVAIDVAADGPRFKDTFASVWLGGADNDGFNRLVLAAGLTWREAMVLRSYGRWLLQLGVPFSQSYMEEVLASNARAAAHLAGLFVCRFDPALAERKRAEFSAQHERALDDLLNAVTRPDDDRILRAFRAAIDATVRTNFFQPGADGQPRPYLSLKLEPRKVPDSPLPRPQFEIFVHSPRVEGVHLRMGKVARGGIRWSDRREDFRTEVLGLMKAQNVKNTLIVPVGAKGGFVPRRLPTARDEIQREGTECYRIFIRALLDVTDNIVAGKLVPPRQVVRRDEDDPYLVVAADKGTATFSDVANALSLEYGHWLGDAFASGGSAGYDHKRMGITAKGGWESVKRHFRELGMDTQQQDFTVAGIGDMAGDVFGNGMLLSKHIKLLAAFNHLHIFLDPSPDPARSYAERRRLFDLPRSSWEDYDARLISKGGGVFSRQAKAIPLSPEARRMLGVEAAAAAPNDVIRAILRMPVDLLWNGGIGTYVKSSLENNAQIGDRANDAVRVDGRELRCKVIGEGGNLGCSQPGRVEYALRGGRLNTDFIDNSAGVNTSDVEVNIKILTNSLTESGRLKRADRDRLLARMTDEVAALVLRNNYLQSQALSTLEAHASVRLAEHGHVIRMLEKSGELNRALESLPADDELAERQRAGKGLTRPELAMILSYSKIWLYDRLIQSDVPEDPYLGRELTRYFPKPIQQRFGNDLLLHRLRREIIATATTNSLVNRMGPVFAIRAQEDTGADLGTIARAYTIAREITGIRTLWAEIEALDNKVPAALQYDMMYETSRLLRHLTYWVLANLGANLDIEAAVSRLQPGLGDLMQSLPRLVEGVEANRYAQSLTRFSRDGVPEGLARRIASLGAAQAAVDIAEIALQLKVGVEHAGRAYFGMGTSTGLDWVRGEIERLAVEGHWQAVARATLREDAYMLQRRLASQAIKAGGKRDAAAAVAAWVASRERYAELVRRTIHEMRSTGAADFPTLSVALQSVRRLTEH